MRISRLTLDFFGFFDVFFDFDLVCFGFSLKLTESVVVSVAKISLTVVEDDEFVVALASLETFSDVFSSFKFRTSPPCV